MCRSCFLENKRFTRISDHVDSGEPTVMEPEKIPSFGWYSLEDMREAAIDGSLVPNMKLALPDIEGFLE